MIKHRIDNWKGIYLGATTCLMFFNPFDGIHEVFPYWAILSPLLIRNINALIFILIILCLGFINYVFYWEFRAIIDSLEIISTFLGVYIYGLLNNEEKSKLCNIFIIFIYLSFVVMVIQKINPQFHDFILHFFSSRDALSSFYIERNGAVTGLSPEPAYGASMIVGFSLILFLNDRLSNFIYFLVLIELYLFRSITGIIYFIYLTLIVAQANFKNFLQKKRILLTIFLLFSILFKNDFLNFINRPFLFFEMLFSSGSLLKAEAIFGSQRLINAYDSFLFFNPIYSTGFSPFAVLSYLSHSVLISVFFLLIYFATKEPSKNFFLSLPFLLFGGPTLSWPLQALLVEKDKK